MIKNNFKKIINLFSAIAIFSVVGVVSAANPALTTVSVSPSSVSIAVSSTTQLTASPLDQNGAAYAATTTTSWSSGNVSVATVDTNGLVTGVSAGTSTITASMNDGTNTVSGASDITVTAPAPPVPVLTSMAITPASSSISVGSTTQLIASLLDQNGAAYAATTTTSWSSGNASVATIDTNGLVTGVSAGTSTIMATAVSGADTVTSTADIVVTANAKSTTTVPVYLEVEADTGTVFPKQLVNVAACPNTQNGTTTTINALCAFNAASLSTDLTWFSFGAQVDAINGVVAPGYPGNTWTFFFNDDLSNFGATDVLLNASDSILWTLGIQPLKISASSISPVVGATTTIRVLGFDTNAYDFEPVSGATIVGVNASTTNASGTVDIFSTSNNPFAISATANGFLQSKSITITPQSVSTPQPVVPDGAPVGGGSATVAHHSVDVNSASQFLLGNEAADGSFGNILYTDWAAIALASNGNSTDKIAAYLKSANSGMYVATDYERHAMALMALGINPYTGTPVNYIQKIIDTFDGTQIGDPGLVNDDIFSLFPFSKAGYNGSDQIIQKVTAFILGKQSGDGSWDGNVDMTAAGIQALSLNPGISGVSQAIAGARSYLSAHQSQDGGFGTSFATSWALQAISALHESQSNWMQNNKTPNDYLYILQASDGGIEPDSTNLNSRIWATSYAIPAALNKSWGDILLSFPKPSSQPAETASGGGSAATAALTGANNQGASSTTELVAATSSLLMSSSTVASTTASTTPALVNEPSAQNTSTASAVSLLRDNHPKAPAGSAVSRGEARVSAAAAKDKQASNAGKKASQPPKPAESGLAGIAVFGHNLLSFAANVGGLIVSKFFSIIGINQ